MSGKSTSEIAIGQRFGRLVVTGPAEKLGKYVSHLCRCDCGREKRVLRQSLLNGATRSCGCRARERASETHRKHGGSRSPEYRSWKSMIERCTSEAHPAYHRYGGRGITVCEAWRKFENFLVDMGERPEGTTLDRIDNDRGYEPGNCRWSTAKDQALNRHDTKMIEAAGQTRCMADWARVLGITRGDLWGRLRRGKTVELLLHERGVAAPMTLD